MAPNPRRIKAKLDALYAQVPDVPCTGACHGACCFAPASRRERERMEDASGKRFRTIDAHREAHGGGPRVGADNDRAGIVLGDSRVGQDGTLLARYRCSMLTEDGRCSIHADRPMICRLFGAAVGLECHKGCEPEGGLLPFEEGMRLLMESIAVGGGEPTREGTAEDLHAILEDPEAHERFRLLMAERRQTGNITINAYGRRDLDD